MFKINKKKARTFNASLAGSVWVLIQDVFEKKHNGKITYSGDDVPEKENAIVVVNHRSWDDFSMPFFFFYIYIYIYINISLIKIFYFNFILINNF